MIRSPIGGVLTGIVLILTLVYFIVKVEALIDGSDPIINQNTIFDHYSTTELGGLDLFAANQQFAVSIIDIRGNLKLDNRYVKLIA